MNPWIGQYVAAERTRDLHREAAAQRLAHEVREIRDNRPARQSRPLSRFIALARTASHRRALT